MTIAVGGEKAGHSTFAADDEGTVRVVTAVEGEEVAEEITRRIVAAGTAYAVDRGEIDGDRA